MNQGQPLLQYGAVNPIISAKKFKPAGRLNLGVAGLCILLPWMLFCCMYAVMSFATHYKAKAACYGVVAIGLCVVLYLCKYAMDCSKKQIAEAGPDASWPMFLAALCCIAWMVGVAAGDINFFYNMEPYYDSMNLNSYPAVDPSTTAGQEVMDAGQMTFVSGSKLDHSKSIAFHNLDAYCVAPIVKGKNQATYDFWAVGMNCCSGAAHSFHCGETGNHAARSGLRVMRADQRDFYRLAVRQAEAAYGIKARHPLFFHWMQDPLLELSAYADDGFKYFLFGIYGFFAFLVFAVIAAMVLLPR